MQRVKVLNLDRLFFQTWIQVSLCKALPITQCMNSDSSTVNYVRILWCHRLIHKIKYWPVLNKLVFTLLISDVNSDITTVMHQHSLLTLNLYLGQSSHVLKLGHYTFDSPQVTCELLGVSCNTNESMYDNKLVTNSLLSCNRLRKFQTAILHYVVLLYVVSWVRGNDVESERY